MFRFSVLLVVTLALFGCATMGAPSIEDTLRQARAGCGLLGYQDLDECAEFIKATAADVEDF
jgi:hypothetical protein